MRPVLVLIFHATAPADAGPLVRALAEARHALAERQRAAFIAAGADEADVVAGPPDGLSFGERLQAELRARAGAGPRAGAMPGAVTEPRAGAERAAEPRAGAERAAEPRAGAESRAGAQPAVGGVIVKGAGSYPLATAADLRRFVEVAAGPAGHAIANNRYSADVVAVSRAAGLAELPPLPADNALPRWLEERAGVAVTDLRGRWRLGVDIDTPLDLILLRDPAAGGLRAASPLFREWPIDDRLTAISDVLSNRRAELLVAGRVSAATLTWLQRGVACRVRALVEERGLRAASRLALAGGPEGGNTRPPRSVLGELLDTRDGPDALARTVARLADAAIIDTRVLLAHRNGSDESSWPSAEDRFRSDLLLPEFIVDPWLAAVTRSAADSPAPILLGGHTMVNGGLRMLAQRARVGTR